MIKALIVGFVFLGSITAHAQGLGLVKAISLVSAQTNTSTAVVTKGLLTQLEGSASALSVLRNDPIYIFNKGNLNEESLRYLGNDSQNALLELGKSTVFKPVAGHSEFKSALSSVTSIEHAADHIPMSPNGKVRAAVNPEKAIENEVRALGLSDEVTANLSNELKGFREEVGLSYTKPGMCKGLDEEAATNFALFLRDARENLKRTRAKCPAQFYGSLAEVWIQFQKRMGREGDSLWRAVEKNQTCYTHGRLRPGVLEAVNQISAKHNGQVPPENEATGCPL